MISYSLLLFIIHITSGCLALLSGLAVMVFRKGGRQHGYWGTWFFASMLVMASTAIPLVLLRPERPSALASVLTLYLVVTSWSAAKRRDGKPGILEWVAVPLAFGCAGVGIWLGQIALTDPSGIFDEQPSTAYFAFAGLAGLAAALDISMLSRGGLTKKGRAARHLWRMCTAYLLAVTSLFFGQQDDVSPFIFGSPILVILSLAPLGTMTYWMLKLQAQPKHMAEFPADQSV